MSKSKSRPKARPSSSKAKKSGHSSKKAKKGSSNFRALNKKSVRKVRRASLKRPRVHLKAKKLLPKLKPKTLKLKSVKLMKSKLKKISKIKIKKEMRKKAHGKAKSRTVLKQVIMTQPVVPPKRKVLSRELQDVLAKAEARHWIIELGGENAIDVIRGLPSVPNDEELAKKLKIKVSDVRASLNKMHNEGLVTYVRDKNSETGWYSYAWVINEDRIKKWVGMRYDTQESCTPKEGTAFYFCKECGLDSAVGFVDATECSFRCQNCNCALDYLDEEKFSQLKKLKP
ncbi:MAG: hypothetical protein PHS02_03805 [Candidatus ainarchaeum sp.]|nr:hypothetical protein [Candidatus ainarchaeum sp.]